MTIIKAYYYFFYKFYKFGEWSHSSFPSDFTATVAVGVLELLALATMNTYYTDFFNPTQTFNLLSFKVLIPVLLIFFVNYFAFINNKKWKDYLVEFDQWSTKENRKGTWVIAAIIVFILANFFLSFYILGKKLGIQ